MLGKVSAFAFRGVALLCQFATIVLLVGLLGAEQFGRYAAAVSASTIVVSLMDFGFTRYSFRLINRGIARHLVYGRVLQIRALSAPVFVGSAIIGSSLIGVSSLELALAIVTALVVQILSYSRYKLIVVSKVSRSIFVESITPVIFCFSLVVFRLLGEKFNSEYALALNCLIAVSVLLSLIWITEEAAHWKRALTSLFNKVINLKALIRTVKHSIPVGVEQSALALWYGVPVLAASLLVPVVRPEAALFQRIFTVVTAILSVFIAIDLRRIYASKFTSRMHIESIGMVVGAMLVGLSAISLAENLMLVYVPVSGANGLMQLAENLFSDKFSLCFSVALLIPYTRVSWLLLGRNLRWERTFATMVGLGSSMCIIYLGVVAYPSFASPLGVIIGSMCVGQLVGLIIMLVAGNRAGRWA